VPKFRVSEGSSILCANQVKSVPSPRTIGRYEHLILSIQSCGHVSRSRRGSRTPTQKGSPAVLQPRDSATGSRSKSRVCPRRS